MTDPLSTDGLERFAEVAAGHVGPEKIPGLVALVSREEQVHVEALGSLAVGGPPVRRDSLFRIVSTSKPVTGAAIMALVDDGVVRLDDQVQKWLPELADRRVLRHVDGLLDDTVPAERPITVHDLLTFTFGFGMVVDMFMAPQPWPVVKAATDLHLLHPRPAQPRPAARSRHLDGPARFLAASGPARPALDVQHGGVSSGSAGRPRRRHAIGRCAAHLPLRATRNPRRTFWATDPSRLATAYVPTPNGLAVWDPPDGQWSHPPAFADGAAGLVSTADGLLAFAHMFLARGASILSKEAVAQMTRDQLTAAQREGTADALLHGRSWSLCQSVITEGPRTGAFGWDGGLGTSWLVDPARDLVVIVPRNAYGRPPSLQRSTTTYKTPLTPPSPDMHVAGTHVCTSAPSSRNRTARLNSRSTSPRPLYVDNDARISRLLSPELLRLHRIDRAARSGPCYKRPLSPYAGVGSERVLWVLSLPFPCPHFRCGRRSQGRDLRMAQRCTARRFGGRGHFCGSARPVLWDRASADHRTTRAACLRVRHRGENRQGACIGWRLRAGVNGSGRRLQLDTTQRL